jgi:hypothetical protein
LTRARDHDAGIEGKTRIDVRTQLRTGGDEKEMLRA